MMANWMKWGARRVRGDGNFGQRSGGGIVHDANRALGGVVVIT